MRKGFFNFLNFENMFLVLIVVNVKKKLINNNPGKV